MVRAVVEEKEEARAEFDAAVAQGKSAYLAEQVRADIFKISVGNLPGNATVTVSLTYVVALAPEGGDAVRFVLPTAVAPRYEPLPAFAEISSATHNITVADGAAAGEKSVAVTENLLARDV